jgi:hypothetical protein
VFGAALVTAAAVIACDRTSPTSPGAPAADLSAGRPPAAPDPAQTIGAPDVVFSGAGDIALCDSDGAERTARILDRLPDFVFALGDMAYPASTADALTRCYQPTWGRHRGRTHVTPGNHDWEVQAGAPYFAYFGDAAGPAGLGYYSFDVGGWRALSLNSNITAAPGSPQYEWVRREVSSGAACSLALWHHPVFSSGGYGNNPHMKEIWRLLDAAGVDLVITAHEHNYERFAPQDADGRLDLRGMRQFVVGTGGAERRTFGPVQPNSEVRGGDGWGVLKLVLRAATYDWEFIPVDGYSFTDRGTGQCQ